MNFTEMQPDRIRLEYWGYAEGTPAMRVKEHSHPYWQANFTLAGRCMFHTGQGDFMLQNQDMIFVAPGVRHSLSYPETYLCCCCKFQTALAGLPSVIHLDNSNFTSGVIRTIKIILETTFPSRFFGNPMGTVIMPGDRYQLLMEYYLTGVLAAFIQPRNRNGILAEIHAQMEKQGKLFFSVAEAAEACGYSRNHFSLLVRRETGLSARDFLSRLKLEKAQHLLRFSHLSIGETASVLGFSSQFHFSDFFKRLTGMAPHQFRKKYSGKNG